MILIPSYKKIASTDELFFRCEVGMQKIEQCSCCPHNCRKNRKVGEYGICNSGYLPIVSSYSPHFGEEPVISGNRGAGNIFFGNCNLQCIYCQNYEISQNWRNEKENEVSFERLADIMIELQEKGCHNIGLVFPTHFSSAILKAIFMAEKKGLSLPFIYNSNGYDSVEILKLYEDVIDIYLPDFKYGNNNYAVKYSYADDYFDYAKKAIKEMFRQLGDELVYDGDIIIRGLIIRHLVLPNGLADSEKIFRFISEELSPKIHLSLMSQYFPTHNADKEILLNRKLYEAEYERTIELMHRCGLENGWIQDMDSWDYYKPLFNDDRKKPFGNISI